MECPVAVFDANVILDITLCSFLLYLADREEVFSPQWTEDIHEEWMRNLASRLGYPEASIEKRRRIMDERFAGALVHGYKHRIDGLALPDPDDRHVLAAAIECEARFIVTYNLKDFPKKSLAPHGIEALTPDAFIARLIESHPDNVIAAAKAMHANEHKPEETTSQFLARLEKHGLKRTATFLRRHAPSLSRKS